MKQKQNPHDRRRDQQQPDHSYPIKSLFLEDIQQLGFGDKHADADHCQRRVHIRQKAHHRLERIRQLQGKQQQRQADIDPDAPGFSATFRIEIRSPSLPITTKPTVHIATVTIVLMIAAYHHPPVAQNLLNHGKAINPQLENIAPNFSTCLRPSGSLLKQKFYDDHRG